MSKSKEKVRRKNEKQQEAVSSYAKTTPGGFAGVGANILAITDIYKDAISVIRPSYLKNIEDIGSALSNLEGIELTQKYSKVEYEEVTAKLNAVKQELMSVKEEQQRQQHEYEEKLYRDRLARYFSKKVIDGIIGGTVKLQIKRRCEMTILNCDIRNFTRFVKELTDPEYLTELLNKYLIDCTQIIHEHGGAVDKYMGDGILAYFGYLNQGRNTAIDACSAALQIVKSQNSVLQTWYDRLLRVPEDKYLGIGVGIATGYTYWDYVGIPSRKELTVIGPHVNLASRLQSGAKPGEILITNVTKGKLKQEFTLGKPDRDVNVKNFDGTIDVYCLTNRPKK